MCSSGKGKLILCTSDGENKEFEPENNALHVGSVETANVCLSGLKNLAFTINIDNFGRVTISNYMKRVKINEKRIAKNVTRSLMNDSLIEIMDYKFLWKYNSKFSKSYSLSPCKKPPIINKDGFNAKNRITMSCFAGKSVNDENAEENIASVVLNKEVDNVMKPAQTPPQNNLDDIMNVTASAKKRKSLLPVKPNRTSELRRASIVKSLSASEDSKLHPFITPKKPIPSATMVKSVNAIMRSEGKVVAQNAKRNTLGAHTSFPKIVENMHLFNVVTDAMKMVGPNKYITDKCSATNSPRRTPKKRLLKQKRLSLQSEITEMGLLKTAPDEVASSSEDTGPTNISLTKQIEDGNMSVENDEAQPTDDPTNMSPTKQIEDGNIPVKMDDVHSTHQLASSTTSSVQIDENAMECLTISDEEDDEVISAKITKQESRDLFDNESSDSSLSIISVEDDSDDCGDNATEDNARVKTPKASDAEFNSQLPQDLLKHKNTDNGHDLNKSPNPNENENLLEGVPTSSQAHSSEQIQEAEESATIQSDELKSSSDESPEILQEIEPDVSTMSTPSKRQSLIRTRRNSRLCSLEECCSPTTIRTPSKSKLTTNVVLTPRSILKTPKPSKTPKKNVRILETILFEEEDEVQKSMAQSENSVDVMEHDNEVNGVTQLISLGSEESVELQQNDEEPVIPDDEVFIEKTNASGQGDKLELENQENVVTEIQSNIAFGLVDGAESSETTVETPNLNGTFDLGSGSEVNHLPIKQEVISPSADSNESLISFAAQSINPGVSEVGTESTIETPKLNGTFDMERGSEVNHLLIKHEVLPSIHSTESQILFTEQSSEKTNVSGGVQPTLTETTETVNLNGTFDMGSESEVNHLSIKQEAILLSVHSTESPISYAEQSLQKTNVSGLLEELHTEDSEVLQKSETHSKNRLTLGENMDAVEPTSIEIITETPNLDVTVDLESENEGKDEKVVLPAQSNEPLISVGEQSEDVHINESVNLQNQLSSGPSDELHTSGLKGNMDLVEPMITETASESLNCYNEINNLSVGNKLASTSQSNEALQTTELQFNDAIMQETDSNAKDQTLAIQETQESDEGIELNVTDDKNSHDDETDVCTPKPLEKTNLIGMKELLKTPNQASNQLDDMRGVKELMNTPKAHDKTNLIGMKELLNTPDYAGNQLDDMRGVKELMNTPKAHDKTNLIGMKELLNTPDQASNQLYDMRGVKELLQTPKPCEEIDLDGVKELVQTPIKFYSGPTENPEEFIHVNYKSRFSLVSKLNNALSELGLKVESLPSMISEEAPSNNVVSPIVVDSNAPVTEGSISVDESKIPKSMESAKIVVETATSSKESDKSTAITNDGKSLKTHLKATEIKEENEPEKTLKSKEVISKKGASVSNSANTEENVTHSSESIANDESEVPRRHAKKKTVVDNSSSKGKASKSVKDTKVPAASSKIQQETLEDSAAATGDENNTPKDSQENVDASDKIAETESVSTALPRRRARKQNVIENSESSKPKGTKSVKDKKVPSVTSNTEAASNDEDNNPMVDSQQSVDGSDAIVENESESSTTRTGIKKSKEVKSKKGTASRLMKTSETISTEHTPSKRNNRNAKQNTADKPKEGINVVNTLNVPTRRLRKNSTNVEPSSIDTAVAKTNKSKIDNSKTSEVSLKNERSPLKLKRSNRIGKTNDADVQGHVVVIDEVPDHSKKTDSQTTSKNTRSKKTTESGSSSTDNRVVPTRRRNVSEAESVDTSNHGPSKTQQRNLRATRNVQPEATTEFSKKKAGPEKKAESTTKATFVDDETAKSKTTRAATKRRRQASDLEPTDDAILKQLPKRSKRKANDETESEQPIPKQPSPLPQTRKGKKNTTTSSQDQSGDAVEASSSTTAVNVSENSQTAKTRKGTNVLTRRARQLSEMESIEVAKPSQRATSSTRSSKRNINATPTTEDDAIPVLKKRPKRGNK